MSCNWGRKRRGGGEQEGTDFLYGRRGTALRHWKLTGKPWRAATRRKRREPQQRSKEREGCRVLSLALGSGILAAESLF